MLTCFVLNMHYSIIVSPQTFLRENNEYIVNLIVIQLVCIENGLGEFCTLSASLCLKV